MIILYCLGFLLVLWLDVMFFGLFTLFIFSCGAILKFLYVNLWFISIPVTIICYIQFRKKQKPKEDYQHLCDDLVFRINRNNARYDHARFTSEYREVYDEYVDIIKIINENMIVELYDIRNKINDELPNLNSKICRG